MTQGSKNNCKGPRQNVHEGSSGVAVCCSVLQCVAVCCSMLQCVAIKGQWRWPSTQQTQKILVFFEGSDSEFPHIPIPCRQTQRSPVYPLQTSLYTYSKEPCTHTQKSPMVWFRIPPSSHTVEHSIQEFQIRFARAVQVIEFPARRFCIQSCNIDVIFVTFWSSLRKYQKSDLSRSLWKITQKCHWCHKLVAKVKKQKCARQNFSVLFFFGGHWCHKLVTQFRTLLLLYRVAKTHRMP